MAKRKIMVTAALPYANGPIHLGHLVEYLQTDIWAKFQKMRGHDCIYLCADDCHGTPISIRARKEGIPPEQILAESYEAHTKDFSAFHINFDHFSSTHSDTNKELAETFFLAMEKKGFTTTKTIDQTYCEHDKMFLPDRFVKGTCPKCKSDDQYGDSCDKCGATYAPTELKDSVCSICENPPSVKASEHIFFDLSKSQAALKEWVPKHTQEEVGKKLSEWLEGELRPWDISRDEPYFGFEIPGHPKKYFYVWVDAPIGYISTCKEWAEKNNKDFDEYWKSDDVELYHFIGKDIIYFHCLFWPAMLDVAGFRKPTKVFAHGFLTVNGEKMSKSKGTFINARTYLEHLDPTYLRYYYACKLSDSIDDIDLNLEDFTQRVNSDLVGKITNLGSRSAKLIEKKYEGKIGTADEAGTAILEKAHTLADDLAELYEARQYSKAMVLIRDLADEANRYFDEKQPWKVIKDDPAEALKSLTTALQIFRWLAIALKPVIPTYTQKVQALFAEEDYTWSDLKKPFTGSTIGKFEHLIQRIDPKKVELLTAGT